MVQWLRPGLIPDPEDSACLDLPPNKSEGMTPFLLPVVWYDPIISLTSSWGVCVGCVCVCLLALPYFITLQDAPGSS